VTPSIIYSSKIGARVCNRAVFPRHVISNSYIASTFVFCIPGAIEEGSLYLKVISVSAVLLCFCMWLCVSSLKIDDTFIVFFLQIALPFRRY